VQVVSGPVRSVLAEAQRIGAIGPGELDRSIAHATQFLAGIPEGPQRVVDLGSGGGVPGLVIADLRRDCHLVLVDRRRGRCDQLTRAIRRLAWDERVEVWCADVDTMRTTHAGAFDVATSRGFGPARSTLHLALACVRNGGTVVISEPPEDRHDRWPDPLPDRVRSAERHGGVRVFHVKP